MLHRHPADYKDGMINSATSPQRSRHITAIAMGSTNPALRLWPAVFARCLRYQVSGDGPSRLLDLEFPGYRATVFVLGCFWRRAPLAAGSLRRRKTTLSSEFSVRPQRGGDLSARAAPFEQSGAWRSPGSAVRKNRQKKAQTDLRRGVTR